MSHYNNKYKKDYKANLSYQAKMSKPVNTSQLNQIRQNAYANQQEALSRCYNPRAQPEGGDGNVYTRENGIITGSEPIRGLYQANFFSWENQPTNDDSDNDTNDDLDNSNSIQTSGSNIIHQNLNLAKKYEEEIEKLKKEHFEQIKQYQNKLDKQKKEFREEIAKLRQTNIIGNHDKITELKELYENELKTQKVIQKEIRELEQIFLSKPIEFKNNILIDLNDNSELQYDILKIQIKNITDENNRLIFIKESYLN